MAAADDWDSILSQLRQRILAVTASNNPTVSIAGRTYQKAEYLEKLHTSYAQAQHYRQDAEVWQIEARGCT